MRGWISCSSLKFSIYSVLGIIKLLVCDDWIFKIKMALWDVLLHNSSKNSHCQMNCDLLVLCFTMGNFLVFRMFAEDLSNLDFSYLGTPAKSFSARSSCQFAINVPLAAFVCLLYAVSVISLKLFKF
jgi:hypothetical protein